MAAQQQTTRAWTYNGPYPAGVHLSKIPLSTGSPLVIDVKACALNPVDVQNINTNYDAKKERGLACDVSGTVVQAEGFKAGDKVFGMTMSPMTTGKGALAERAELDAAGTALIKKPDAWSDEQAAALPLVWLTARTCIEHVAPYMSGPGGGDTQSAPRLVVLGGSSSTGIYTVILAKRRGWRVLSTSSSRNKSFLLDTLHVDEHVDYTSEDVRKRVTAFKPTAIVDCVGGTECVGVPGNRSYVSIVGDKTSRATMGGPYTYWDYRSPVYMLQQWIRWARGRVGLGEQYDVVILSLRRDWLQEAADTLSVDDIYIDSVFSFDEADKAFARLDTGRAKGKVVVKI